MCNKKIGIYIITNIKNNKCYIGQSIDLKNRISAHKGMLKNNKHSNVHLMSAFLLDGIENFMFEILEEGLTKEQLDDREIYWIMFYQSNKMEYGYNIETGGAKNKTFISDETRLKMRNAKLGKHPSFETIEKMKNKKISEETKQKISQTMKEKKINVGEANPRYGKPGTRTGMKNSEETRMKISLNRKGIGVGENNAFFGQKHTTETRQRISKSRKGIVPVFKNPEERCRKLSLAKKEWWRAKKEETNNNRENFTL